jgi:hypothetical protein
LEKLLDEGKWKMEIVVWKTFSEFSEVFSTFFFEN